MKKRMVIGISMALSLLMSMTSFAGSWIQDTNRPENQNGISNWWYQNDDGTYAANGWYWLDGNKDGWAESYRFDESGWLYVSTKVDSFDVDGSGAWVIDGTVQKRQMEIPSASQTGNQETAPSGEQSSGSGGQTVKNQWINDGYGKRYYDSKGELTTGWKKISSKQYYFDDSGYMVTGYQEIDGNEFYFYENGEQAKKTVYDSNEGVYYVLDKREYFVMDIVDEDEWNEYRREADKESVNVSDVKDENQNGHKNTSGVDLYEALEEGHNEEWAMACFDLINEEREKKGLDPLVHNEEIQELCDIRAEEILEKFSHERPDGSQWYSLIIENDISYSTIGENICEGYSSPEAAVNGWMNSTGHRKNILTEAYEEGAIGFYYNPNSIYKYHWVQIFYTPCK